MSDTMAALLILPVLFALVVVLECTRLGCTHLSRRLRRPARSVAAVDASTDAITPLQSL